MMHNGKRRTILLFVTLFIALVGGYVGSWVYVSSINRINGNNLINYNPNSNLVIRDAKKIVIEQDKKIAEIISSVENNLVGIFKANKTGEYSLFDEKSQALIVTSDGWLITNFQTITKNNLKDYVVIEKDKQVYTLDQIVKDTDSNFVFLHIKDVKDLPVREFAKASDLHVGQTVIGANWFDSSWQTVISSVNKNIASIKSSDVFNQEIILQNVYGENNLALSDLSGKIIALVDNKGRIISSNSFIATVNSLLVNKKIMTPKLGVNYINISLLVTELANKGVLIKSIDKGSSAELAKLKAGDIILSINGTEIDQNNDLVDIVSGYKPEEKININYLRGGEVLEVEVTLE